MIYLYILIFACCSTSFFRMGYTIPLCGFTFMCLSTFSLMDIISWFFLLWVVVTYLKTHILWFPGGMFILFLIRLFPKAWCIHISIRIDVCVGSLGHADVSMWTLFLPAVAWWLIGEQRGWHCVVRVPLPHSRPVCCPALLQIGGEASAEWSVSRPWLTGLDSIF